MNTRVFSRETLGGTGVLTLTRGRRHGYWAWEVALDSETLAVSEGEILWAAAQRQGFEALRYFTEV